MRTRTLCWTIQTAIILPLGFGLFLNSHAFASEMRQWSDSTGGFKVQATLVEVENGVATLKSNQGKTLKVPVAKLSKADQAYLQQVASASPFEEVEDSPFEEIDTPATTDRPAAEPKARGTGDRGTADASRSPSSGGWRDAVEINWQDVDVLDTTFIDEWSLELPSITAEPFATKRVALKKKFDRRENLSSFCINNQAGKAVLGYTTGKPGTSDGVSRITLIDLSSGKSLVSDPVEGLFGPMTTLSDGITVVMRGMVDWHGDKNKKDVLQLWRINGKKITRTKSWIPFPPSKSGFSANKEVTLRRVVAAPEDRLILETDDGQLACIDSISRDPLWYAQLSKEHSIDLSPDGSLLAVTDMGKVMIVDPVEGVVLASTEIELSGGLNWPSVHWSPSGSKLLFTYNSSYQVLDLSTGEWLHQGSMNGSPLAMSGVSYVDDDYMLVGNKMLVHLPSMIQACEYLDTGSVAMHRGLAMCANQAENQGIVFGVKLPHPQLEKLMDESSDDPNLFIIRPDVEVSINASAAGTHAGHVTNVLQTAATDAGYKIVPSASIQLVASVSTPKSEEVNYIREGRHTVSVMESKLALVADGQEIWKQTGNNMPWSVFRLETESFTAKLQEIAKTPNLHIFEKPNLPRKLQKPSPGQGPQQTAALTKASVLQLGAKKATPGRKSPALK